MSEVRLVEHTGYVEEINSNQVKVRIISESACASCHAKGACTAADMKEKLVDVYTNQSSLYKPGQKVTIQGEKSLGLKASLLAYIFPFILVFVVLFVSYGLTKSEGIAGITSLIILIPYFIVIKYISPQLQKTFTFKIKE
ncbi:SoxR reducing system RseC family protein [Plebeiibacterium sediminum]|uniref:SoxR reducing system RseC family protein n=1 Tax=Plebeiibacterium sediminum TaxID=2992112 RepID=A0AAE3M2Q5_9BACT|nr:SoxR reducing system RseC family protein [Plebeiobacterium sediminum]MCW3786044.1 SoxR reducing system RseC family protein [Plebeiobacterium sediminum]